MTLDLTFKQVCELVKKDAKKDPKLIEAVDNLLGLALICAPLVIGPEMAALLPALAVKNEIIKVGKFVFEKLSKGKDDDYVSKQQRMQIAYGLLSFTAFFEALDTQIPKELRDAIRLLASEKQQLAASSGPRSGPRERESTDLCQPQDRANPLADLGLAFPHPTESLAQQIERHATLWKQMGEGFQQFTQNLASWKSLGEKDQAKIRAAIVTLPEESAKCFEAQYVELARRYPDFAVWANLQEHKSTKALIADLATYVGKYASLSTAAETSLDIGFTRLHEAILSIPETLQISQATDLVVSLTKHYQARIEEPIIEDKDEIEEGKPRLSFPRVCDAFVPQSFRVLRQMGKAKRLEDESAWDDLPRRNNLGAFMLSYLSSPYSTESPLLVLGHPGSGKSLLTTVLSAQLMSMHYTAVRVPLREVNAEAGIVAQIEESIGRITNVKVDSWAKLSGAFKNNPPLVILDGYDELLQASGKVFSGYLKDVQTFQKNEAEQGRPVRVIVTSRITLIDKATIPVGATILRLLEFEKKQRERWVSIWNRSNTNYFRNCNEITLPI